MPCYKHVAHPRPYFRVLDYPLPLRPVRAPLLMAAGSPGRYCVSETFVIFLQLSIVALCWLAEHYFPRLSNRGDSVRRVFSILVVWAAALGAVAFCQAYLFQPLISLVDPF